MPNQTRTNKHKSRMIVGLAILAAIILLGGVAWHFVTPAPSASTSAVVTLPASSSFDLASSLLSGSPPTLGSPNASVTIVEFGDYQCPTCGAWYHSQEALLIQNLVDSRKAKLVWRDFDYFGPDSVSASEAAYAAGEQGKFWQFYDLLFQNQQTPNNGWASRQNMETFAQQLGLNITQFNQSFNSGKYDSLINANHSLGVQAGVTETPTFFLIGPNGRMITIAGGQPESVFEQAVASLTSA
ncbi:MAG: DsbA family protein [Candidatus Bathyarchaeia archaeon]